RFPVGKSSASPRRAASRLRTSSTTSRRSSRATSPRSSCTISAPTRGHRHSLSRSFMTGSRPSIEGGVTLTTATAQGHLSLTLTDGEPALRCPFEDRERAKRIHGCRWHKESKTWRFPPRPEVLEALQNSFPLLPVPDEVRVAVEQVRRAEEAVAELKEAEDAEVDVPTR